MSKDIQDTIDWLYGNYDMGDKIQLSILGNSRYEFDSKNGEKRTINQGALNQLIVDLNILVGNNAISSIERRRRRGIRNPEKEAFQFSQKSINKLLERMARKHSGGEGASHVHSEPESQFDKLSLYLNAADCNLKIKQIILSDHEEAERCYKAGAHKACMVMLGAVLEGYLQGMLSNKSLAKKINENHEDFGNVGIKINEIGTGHPELLHALGRLRLEDYIQALTKLELGMENFSRSMQDFRNGIHPNAVLQGDTIFSGINENISHTQLSLLVTVVDVLNKYVKELS